MRKLGIGFAAAALLAPLVMGLPSASASCGGPQITVTPNSAAAGSTVTVHGQAFGDNCYDTGPPPAGQGVLGNPLTDVEIGFVQHDITTVLATVDANDEYEFTVEVTVPTDAEPGQAAFTATPPTWVTLTEFTVAGAATPAPPIAAIPDFTG